MTEQDKWIRHYVTLAEQGDFHAQISVAWEYVKGGYLPYDRLKAEHYFQSAEKTSPLLARFHHGKAKILWGDSPDDIHDMQIGDGNAGYSPAYYIIASSFIATNRKDAAVKFYRLAARCGHLPSEVLLWRSEGAGFWGKLKKIPRLIQIFFQMVFIRMRDAEDHRILT
ncbi:hypothetical protein E4V01_07470 [Methylorubrum sp. Q1]|uniref:hypothetical protein n=1 Tax=Methylorubrum sp. Q1 TaxID=2562453 RepID=UPI001076AA8B|nr:hypothetical protein [Methylorubrum sp. Q1]TFZ59781.1 hypothetical protein E4V01_07470 [Methylorubrum sp. Q1]